MQAVLPIGTGRTDGSSAPTIAKLGSKTSSNISPAVSELTCCVCDTFNHFHLVLRSRPDVVATWDDSEVARRWLLLCPVRKRDNSAGKEPSEAELNAIRNDVLSWQKSAVD